MKAIIIPTFVLTTAVGAIGTEIGYDYPPEYADLFGQFRAITPEEAEMLVSAKGVPPGDDRRPSRILEPISVKCEDGLPGYYLLLSYKGDDAQIRRNAEEIIDMLNTTDGFDPYELAEKYEPVKKYREDFCTFLVDAWTWTGVIGLETSTLSIYLLDDLPLYITLAEKHFGVEGVAKAKLYAPGVLQSMPVLALESSDGGILYVRGPAERLTAIDKTELENMGKERLDRLYAHFKSHTAAFGKARKDWAETINQINSEAVKIDGYYRVRPPEEPPETDGKSINYVPDFNINLDPYPDDCWRWTLTSVFTYWSQKEKFRFLHFAETIPPLGNNSSTTNYGTKIYHKITDWMNTNNYSYLINQRADVRAPARAFGAASAAKRRRPVRVVNI